MPKALTFNQHRAGTARPDSVDTMTGWMGSELGDDPARWRRPLRDAEIDELLEASARFAAGDDDLPIIDATDFPLPHLAAELAALRHRLLHGLGFELWTGLPVDEIPRRQAAAVFLGIGAHLGSLRSQNAMGHLLGHVTDIGRDPADPTARIYQTNARQSFHTDSTDVVGLLCLATAATGGESLLAHAGTVLAELERRRPDLASRLFEPVATDRRGEVPPGADPWFEIPVLSRHDGHLTVIYQRQYIDSAQRFADAPRLDAEMIEALDLFDEIVNEPDVHLSMALAPGDMQFVHNHTLLHDREGFVDDPARPRHLLRLWLSIPGDRELPPVFATRYGSITVGDRGGIITEATTRLHAPLAPA